ncbi:FAD-dependent oxidoreductase [Hyphomonas sp.]|jgi:predicted NAD/FAD-binding protein|uniref:FAD-dependent oxidoreductase n=1 Tax=Hyphomonas sp. TaxID=87 RepID=UPI0025C4010E|nr:FAD-dependent oxidoreductase [Hyphomonas sp.]
MQKLKIAVIGGGPGGLSAAQFILEAGHQAVVFEKDNRIGGKSFSFSTGDAFNEMGTCYTTRQHVIVKRWMKQHGIHLRRLGEARYDDAPVVDYVKKGAGPPLAVQALKFVAEAGRLRRRIAEAPSEPAVLAEASMTVDAWLARLDLPKLDLAMHRILPAQGYGYAQEVTIGQTVQWCDFDLLISGVLNDMHMPVEGWSEFWKRFATRFDIRLEAGIEQIERRDNSVVVVSGGGRERFDALVSTLPMDEFARLTNLLPAEQAILDGVEWQNYTTTLVSSKNWFTGAQVHGYSRACKNPSLRGAMLGSRREGEVMEDGARLYVTGQFSNGLTPPELREILLSDIERLGVTVETVIYARTWKYFPQYRAEAVADGLFTAMREAQGGKRTWFSGATFSHELVSSVVERSRQSVRDLVQRAG